MKRRNHLPPPEPEPSGTNERPIYPGIVFAGEPGWDPETPYSQRTVLLPNGKGVHPDHIPEEFRAQMEAEERLRGEQYQQYLDYLAAHPQNN